MDAALDYSTDTDKAIPGRRCDSRGSRMEAKVRLLLIFDYHTLL